MNGYISGAVLRELRERQGLTQKQLGERLGVSDKAVSKWETGRGLPDITLLEGLASELGVSVSELLAGEQVVNANTSGNVKKTRFYVCPVCGNILTALGEAAISCCGVALPALEVEDNGHEICVEYIEHDRYVTLDHPMTKEHSISFVAQVTSDRLELVKLYPEQDCAARFTARGHGILYACCNHHGLSRKLI